MSHRTSRRHTTVKSRGSVRRLTWVAMGIILSATAVLQCYLITSKLSPITFYSGDCGTKLLQAQSLAMQHWKNASIVYPGKEIDSELQFVDTGMLQVRKGRLWGVHSLLFALPASLTYAWLGYRGLYLVPALSLLATLFILWLLAKGISPGWRALFALGLAAFTSPLLFYGLEYWEHTLAVFLTTGAIWLIFNAEGVTARPRHLAGSGVLCSLAVMVRPEALIFAFAVILGFVTVVRPARVLARSLGFFALGSMVILIPAALLNWRLFGDPLGTVLGLHLHQGNPDPRLMIVEKLLMPFTFTACLKLTGAVLAALLLWWLAKREANHRRDRVSAALGLLVAAIMAALAAVEGHRLLALWRAPAEVTSLVESFPVIWALPLIVVLSRFDTEIASRNKRRFLAVVAGIYMVGVLITSPTWAGAQWGPRLLLLAMPLLALFFGRVGNTRLASGRAALFAVFALALISIGVQASGLKWLVKIKSLYANTVHFFERETSDGDVLVSNQFWFHEILASLYYQRRFFYVSSPTHMADFINSMRSSRVPYFYFLLPREVAYPNTREKVGLDLLNQLKRQNLLGQGLTLEHVVMITDRPYYLIRLGTGLSAHSP